MVSNILSTELRLETLNNGQDQTRIRLGAGDVTQVLHVGCLPRRLFAGSWLALGAELGPLIKASQPQVHDKAPCPLYGGCYFYIRK